MSYWVKSKWWMKWLFPKHVWKIKTSDKKVYLTFDDGPTPQITQWVLEQLKIYNAKATFFCIGNNIQKYPEILTQVLNENHAIGNHTFDHLNGWKSTTAKYVENVLKSTKYEVGSEKMEDGRWKVEVGSEKEVRSLGTSTANCQLPTENRQLKTENRQLPTDICQPTTDNCQLFRPPFGKIKPSQSRKLRALGYKIIMWDVISYDFDQTISKEKCLENVLTNIENGSIIVFHDSVKAWKNLEYVLPKTLQFLDENGYSCEKLT